MPKKAIVTGITGQDGSYMAELLLEKGYEVHGIKRRSSLFNTDRIDHLYEDPHSPSARLFLHHGDMTDSSNLIRIIQSVQPDEIYNLAAMSHVHVSFETPEYTGNVDALGTLRVLEAIRILGLEKKTRIYHASTSELFGKVQEIPQSETTPFYPRSPYGVAKIYAYWITRNYREAYDLFACNGILFNHESPRRGETFVTRKITRAVAEIALGREQEFFLGNMNAKRDWGHAKDYVKAMWMMLQHDVAEDFVVATGEERSVRDFVRIAFAELGVEINFQNEGVREVGIVSAIDQTKFEEVIGPVKFDFSAPSIGQEVVKVDPYYFRPTEVEQLLGDPSKIKKALGWEPEYNFEELVSEMIRSDLDIFRKKSYLDFVTQ